MLLRLLCAVLMIGVMAGPVHAVTLFSDTFDNYGDEAATVSALQSRYGCSYSSPSPFAVTTNEQAVSTAQVFSGPFSIRQRYTGSQYANPPQGGGSCSYDFLGFDGSLRKDIWITWYHRFDGNFKTGGDESDPLLVRSVATKGLYMYMKSLSTGQENGWVFHYFYGGTQLTLSAQGIKDARGPASGGFQPVPYDTENMWHNVQGYSQPKGRWVCYEANYRLNDPGVANGQYLLYAQDMTLGGPSMLLASYTNREFLGATPSDRMPSDARWFRFRFYRQDGLGDMWYDNVRVDTTRVGCSGAPPPSDTTPPAQVAGLSSPSKTAGSISYTWTANTESDLQQYTIQGCTGAACTNFGTVGTRPAGQNNFTWTGLAANTLYRLRVAAQDTSNNVGTFSSIVDVTTNAATTLPTVTNFTTTATGGTITYTGTPTDFRIAFGGTNGDGTFWNSQIIRTLEQVLGGALSFNWPATTNWACAHARDAVAAEDPIEYRCNSVTPAAPGATPTGTYLRKLSSNPRWLTLDGSTAIYRVGISGGNNCTASYCGLQDIVRSDLNNLITSTTIIDTFDGTASDIGTSWTGGYTNTVALTKNSGVVYESVDPGNGVESRNELLFGDQFAQVTLGTWTGAGFSYMRPYVRMSDPGGASNGYACAAILNGGGQTSRIERVANDVSTVLTSENAITWATGNIVRCRAIGDTIYLDRSTDSGATWVNLLSATDATYQTGRVGLMMNTQTTASNGSATEFRAGPIVADYVTMLDDVVAEGGNWVRYWTLEQTNWCSDATCAASDYLHLPFTQLPWQWTGTTRTDTSTGTNIVVGVYDLADLNQSFFDRVSQRIDAALARGITPIITMFSGGHLMYGLPTSWNAGFSHPFYSGNNINGISCDTNANEACEEAHSLADVNITNAQKAYINRLVQTVGNRAVILEVSNEDQTDSTDWQNMVMEQVRTAETLYGTDPHIIFQSGWGNTTNYPAGFASSAHLFSNSRNDAVSPLCTSDGVDWDLNPTANDGTKLIFYDSDHTGNADSCGTWTSIVPWKLFTRGIYSIFLSERESAGVQTAIKTAMAQTNLYSTKINLATAYPETGTSIFSTGYGLFTGTNSTTPNCSEYIMLMPSDGSSTINLAACSAGATFNVTYLNLTSGAESSGGTTTGGASRAFNPAGSDPMVVLLELDSVTDVTAPVIINCTTSPAGVLPAGTTSVTVSCTTDENATVKMDSDPDIAYASHDTTFSTTGTTAHSQSVGSLSDGTSYTRYVRASDGTNATTSDYVVSWSVAADAVSTIPADVTNLRGTLDYSAGTILWQWDAVSGAASYLLEISLGDVFLTAVESSANSGTTYTQSNLTVGTYTARIKAINGANEQSANWAGSVPVVTELPPTVTGVAVSSNLSSQVVLSFTAPSQSSLVSIVERSPTGCTDWTSLGAGPTNGFTDNTVSANTLYCYRVKFSNPVFGGTSASWSDTVQVTTPAVASGALISGRRPVPFGQPRAPRN